MEKTDKIVPRTMQNMQTSPEQSLITENEKEEVNLNCLISNMIPKRYVNIKYNDEAILNKIIKSDKSFFIHGKVGTGKTVLMANVMKDYIKKNSYQTSYYNNDNNFKTSAEWISYPKFIMELQVMFRNNKQNPHEYATQIAECKGLLAIDDLGAEKTTEFVRQITYFIINEREQNMNRVIITSNYTLDQIDEMIDERVSSRIIGMCEIVELTGKDRRLK